MTDEAERISELAACPFCGCLAWVHMSRAEFQGEPGYRVECEGACHAMTCWWHTEAEAIAAWNRRPSASGSAGVPEGWRLVPVEITLEMQHAYFGVVDKNLERVETDAAFGRYASQQEAYRAMLAASPPPPEGVGGGDDPVNDTKYAFRDGRVWNRADGLPIPDEEPVMVFRARDKRALPLIERYAELVALGDPAHVEAVHRRHEAFAEFARQHPDRMKEPDTAPSSPRSQDNAG